MGFNDDTRIAELEAALLETEQRLARVGELEFELRQLSLERERLVHELQHATLRRRVRLKAGKARNRLRRMANR